MPHPPTDRPTKRCGDGDTYHYRVCTLHVCAYMAHVEEEITITFVRWSHLRNADGISSVAATIMGSVCSSVRDCIAPKRCKIGLCVCVCVWSRFRLLIFSTIAPPHPPSLYVRALWPNWINTRLCIAGYGLIVGQPSRRSLSAAT